MIRKFNYTKRKRIRRNSISIQLSLQNLRLPKFDAFLKLAEYELPPDAKVYVEAYNLTQYMRFDFGTVASTIPPEDRALSEFEGSDDVKFRVKIVQKEGVRGKLLAEADGIFPLTQEEIDQGRDPLLYVRSAPLGQQVWDLRFEGEHTVLLINSKVPDRTALARSKEFIALIYPAVIRQILTKILIREREELSEKPTGWKAQWLQFAAALPGMGDARLGEIEDESAQEDWINDAISAFCTWQNAYDLFMPSTVEE